MRDRSTAAEEAAEGASVGSTSVVSASAIEALCLIARLHQVAADPALVTHQLGWRPGHVATIQDLLLAAKHVGLKAKAGRSTADRLSLVPLPALALLRDGEGIERVVVLAQCDGQRVLFQDPNRSPDCATAAMPPCATRVRCSTRSSA